jgi:hypothetical protein
LVELGFVKGDETNNCSMSRRFATEGREAVDKTACPMLRRHKRRHHGTDRAAKCIRVGRIELQEVSISWRRPNFRLQDDDIDAFQTLAPQPCPRLRLERIFWKLVLCASIQGDADTFLGKRYIDFYKLATSC